MSKTTVRPFDLEDQFVRMHNTLFDSAMPAMSPNSWKVFCFIIRKTLGFNKKSDMVSYTQIMKGCGISGRSTVSAALKELTTMSAISSATGSAQTSSRYRINQQFTIETSPEIGPDSSPEIGLLAVQKLDTQKTVLKDKEKTGETRAPRDVSQGDLHRALFSAISDACVMDVTAKPIAARVGRCASWLARKDGIKPDHVAMFSEWWQRNDWRGQKGEKPTPEFITSEWAKFAAGYKPKPSKATGRTFQRTQVQYSEADRRAAEERARRAMLEGEE